MKIQIIVLILAAILASCGSPKSQDIVTDVTFEPAQLTKTPSPVVNYSIPEKTPRSHVLTTISNADVVVASEKEIAYSLFEKMLGEMKLKDVSDNHRITDYEIVYFRYGDGGSIKVCYVVTPATDQFFMVNDEKLSDGRIRICYGFEVAKDENLYYLSGYYGG